MLIKRIGRKGNLRKRDFENLKSIGFLLPEPKHYWA